MKSPIVSIILPTYNGAQLISRTIKSVCAQTYIDWELLVISDGSTDQTKAAVEQFSKQDSRIIFFENEKNSGIQKTLNVGIGHAKGVYIARIDDDDCWTDTTKLAAQISFFEMNPGYVLIGTDATVVDTDGKLLSKNTMPKTDKAIRTKLLSKNCFLHATVLIKKEILQKVGGYSEAEKFLHAEDYELWLRLGKEGKVANLGLVSTELTARDESLTSKNRVRQARHMITAVLQNRTAYPHFFRGMCVAITRYIFFATTTHVPVPRRLFYFLQRLSKNA